MAVNHRSSNLLALALALGFGCSDDAGVTPEGPTSGSSMGMTATTAAPATTSTTGSASTGSSGVGQAMASTVAGASVSGASTQSTGIASGGSSASVGAGGASGTGTPSSSSGSAGTGGAGSPSTAAGGAGGSGTTMGSSGCGMMAQQATGEWVEQARLSVRGADRVWSIYLPDNYDPMRAYPLVIQLHGCTGGTNNVPVERVSGDNAIHVRGTGSAANTCWETSANGPDVEFFDAMLAEVTTRTCVDETRVFASGYSSGSWLISVLACIRGDRLRAVGTVAGGNALFGNQECPGTVAQIFIHDQNDTENQWSNHESAMERLIDVNGCSPDGPIAEEPEPCVRYQGCTENPVKFCPTTGRGHDRQDNYAPQAFWDFFSEF